MRVGLKQLLAVGVMTCVVACGGTSRGEPELVAVRLLARTMGDREILLARRTVAPGSGALLPQTHEPVDLEYWTRDGLELVPADLPPACAASPELCEAYWLRRVVYAVSRETLREDGIGVVVMRTEPGATQAGVLAREYVLKRSWGRWRPISIRTILAS